ncbi:MAG: S4 domain-containing protein, partial [Terriglobales bacterium]
TLAEIEAERSRQAPMATKMGLARRITSDFHGATAAEAAELEWRRIHQEKRAPSDAPLLRLAAGSYRARDLVVKAGLAKSNSDAERLVKAGAVKRDGKPLDVAAPVTLLAGESFVLQVGARHFVRIEPQPVDDK